MSNSVSQATAIAATTRPGPLARTALVALFACVAVAGCGGGDEPTTTTTPPPVSAPAPAPAPRPAPALSAFTPDAGPPGTLVTITGTNLSGTTAVRFNGTAVTFSQVSATQLAATVSAGATTGTIAVTTPNGTATSSASFAVTVPPKRLRVFVLAGQSNMLGYGKVDLGGNPGTTSREPNVIGGLGSLRAMVDNNPSTYGYLVDAGKPITYPQYTGTKTYPGWVTRNDVWVSHWTETSFGGTTVESRNGGLTVGFGAQNTMPEGYIGPEYGFGQVIGNALGDPVLLIKTSWGGRSLAVDFRPPSSGGAVGPYYKEMVAKVRQVLDNLKTHYPAYDGAGYEISGFGWHQGWNDRVNKDYVAQYEVNMANLIRDLRKEFGAPAMPVVIGNTGMAVEPTDTQALALITAQGNVANPSRYPEFAGTVSTVDTRAFYFGGNSPTTGFGFHWNYNAESYFRIGESMGTAMVKLLKP